MSKMRAPICIFQPGRDTADVASDLDELFTDDTLDKKVVVVSIAGRFRQGKSFLMNFIIKYLRARGAKNWLDEGAQNELGGFDWRHTRKRVTLGVLIWPEIFKIKDASGEELIVILLDTQGVFDTDSTIKECTTIFSLSVLLSSIQIFNIRQNIQGDDLSHLELFTEFGRLVCSENSKGNPQSTQKPFQDLIFLVRDWAYPGENAYGWHGGQQILDEELRKTDAGGELGAMRASIKNCFESYKCFLMPHPGEKVDTSSEFRGRVSDMKPIFVKHMKPFIEDIFRPSNLKPKRVHGRDLTVRDFLVFVELYVCEMHSDKLPTPRTLYDATVNATNSAVVNSCFEMYQARVAALIANEPKEPALFEELHDSVSSDVFAHFNQSTKMGGQGTIAAATEDLKARIARSKDHFKYANSAAFDKRQFEAKTEKLLREQNDLKSRITEIGDQNGDLERRLVASQVETKTILAQAEQSRQAMLAALAQARRRRKKRKWYRF